jgi:hypothetical protein
MIEESDNVKVVSFGLKKMVPKMTRKPVKESFNIPLHKIRQRLLLQGRGVRDES